MTATPRWHLAPTPPATDARCALAERVTGHPLRWWSSLPVFHALQWLDHEPDRAGLVWSTPAGPFAFAALRFDPRLAQRLGITPADLAAMALDRLGLLEARDMPRPFRRALRVRPIPAHRVTGSLAGPPDGCLHPARYPTSHQADMPPSGPHNAS